MQGWESTKPLVFHVTFYFGSAKHRTLPRMLPPSRPHEDMRRSGHFDDAIHGTFLGWTSNRRGVELFCWRVYNAKPRFSPQKSTRISLCFFMMSFCWEKTTQKKHVSSLHRNIGNLPWDLLPHLLGDASST